MLSSGKAIPAGTAVVDGAVRTLIGRLLLPISTAVWTAIEELCQPRDMTTPKLSTNKIRR
ncbi:MAG: hypothetical protein C4287_06755 [Leptolyngbya sp. ERB_1_2]